MDRETKEMFELVIKKIDGVDKKIDSMETRMESIEGRIDSMENKMEAIEGRIDSMETRMKSMESRQDEIYRIARGLEHNIKNARAEQENMSFTLIDIQGGLKKVTGELEEHDTVIKQIRAIK